MNDQIQTTFVSAATDPQGQLKMPRNASFRAAFNLGLLTGLADAETQQLPTDAAGKALTKEHLLYLINDCTEGITAIGQLLACVGSTPDTEELAQQSQPA